MKTSVLRLSGLYAILLLLIVSLTGCEKDPAKELLVSQSSVELGSDGAAVTVDVTANIGWTASVTNGSWLQISPKKGSSSLQMQVKADANISGAERSATVTLKADADASLAASFIVKQVPVQLTFSPDPVKVKAEGETVSINITSNTSWKIEESAETSRVTLSQTSGTGNATISAVVTANPNNKYVKIPLKFSYFGIFKTLYIEQEPGPNTAPAKPEFTSPVNGAENVYSNVKFAWNCKDADGDTLTYHLYLSKDGAQFDEYGPIWHVRSYSLPEDLDINTKYYAKLKADDGVGETSESDVISFTTASTSLYADGEWVVYQESTKPNPVKLIFTGDGFVKGDYERGGHFDTKVDWAIEGLFSVEPYKTYREYFTVYKIAAYSQESGTTITADKKQRSTAFSAVCEGGGSTGISCNYDKVNNWVQKIPGITSSDLSKCAVCVIINEPIYAGTCLMTSNGESISMVPLQRSDQQLISTLTHEMGGHGFGRLVDEYVTSDSAPSAETLASYAAWQGYGAGLNMSLTSSMEETPWSMLLGQQGYGHVSMYEGGWLYQRGVWRSESISCMNDNRLYFDSISRYLIVKRIMSIAGEEFTLEKFIANDVQKTDNTGQTKSSGEKFVPLAPPVFVID